MLRKVLCISTIILLGGACFAMGEPAKKTSIPSSEISAAPITLDENMSTGCYLGVFREGAPKNMGFITNFEKQFAKKPAMIMWYADYSSDFPAADCQNVVDHGAVPHIVWEPWMWGDEEKIKLKNIVNGEWDQYITQWAKDAKTFKKPVFVRWAHEFNIEKYPWGIGNNGRDAELYIKAYRHVHDIFTKIGAKNVKWIWCFNNYPNPDEAWNDYELTYPGDDYVDWIGIDGYNWGNSQTWSGWQSFKELFRDQVRDVSKNHPKKPVMIAEFGSAEDGGDKAAWVKAIPDALKISMKQVKAIVLFDIKKECDWRSYSCKKTEDAYKAILKDPYFLSSTKGIDELSLSSGAGEKKLVTAKKASKTIKIDGDFTPFKDCTPIVMDNASFLQEGGSWKGVKDLSASIYMMWDNDNIYVYAKITDSYPMVNSKTNGDIWNGDCIEMTVPSYQIGLSPGDGRANKPSIWIWQKKKASVKGEIFSQRSVDPTGYIIETKIPWKELGFITPKAGEKLPFDIAVDDADETWQRKAQLVWNGDYLFYKDPDVWGELKFEN